MRFLRTLLMHCFYVALWLKQRATLGAQIAVIRDGEVLLVRHSYKPGWHLPGGGVDPPERPEETAVRELREETGFRLTDRPLLIDVFPNPSAAAERDYITAFRATAFEEIAGAQKSWEIAELRWFPLTAPPPDCTPICLEILTRLRQEQV